MNTTTAIIGASIAILVVIILFTLMRRRAGGDMIERQKRETTGLLDNAPRPDPSDSQRPSNIPSDEQGVLAVPEIRSAIERGRKIEAIKLVRERAGMGLKEAKELVDRASRK